MKKLTGLDALWLYMETKTCPMHVGGVNVFGRPDDPSFSPLDAVRRQFASRVGSIAPLRRVLVSDPLGLDHPYWVVDGKFDLDDHIHHLALPKPDDDTLTRLVARLMETPLDRSRPLWEAHVIEGLEGNNWALFQKYHHAAIDGGAGILLADALYDKDSTIRTEMPELLFDDAEDTPGAMELAARASKAALTQPMASMKYQYSAFKDAVRKTREMGLERLRELSKDTLKSVISGPEEDRLLFLPTRTAPPTPWNKPVSVRRDFLCHSLSLNEIKTLRLHMECSVNDVVMTMCAGGLRRYLLEHDALPDEPLVAAIPVSERTGEEEDTWVNRISIMLTQLPTNVDGAMERAAAVKSSTGKLRDLLQLTPRYALGNIAEYSAPLVASTLAQLTTRPEVSDRTGSMMNLTLSNVPGNREPLYVSGAQLQRTIPTSLLNEGVGLNITVLSYTDRLEMGLTACPKAIPDLARMRECLLDELSLLRETYLADT
ncbi:MAG: wax ester/triacylglycerol synthase family O-acyltransferase [Congregibacter sp.]